MEAIITAFAQRRKATGSTIRSYGDVLTVRGEPIAYWAGDTLRYSLGVWHTVEARQALDRLCALLELSATLKGRAVSSATWYELGRK